MIYSGAYEPLPGVPFALSQDDSYPGNRVLINSSMPTITFDRTAAVAMLLVVVFCALAIRGQRRQQSAALPE